MDIQFPEQQDEFPRTMAKFIGAVLLCLAIGVFLGRGLGALFGTDQSVINTSTYTDRMGAIRTVFTDGDQLDSYARSALALRDMEGLRLIASKNKDTMLALWQNEARPMEELFDEDMQKSLREMMHTEDALYGVETAAGSPIDDVYLRNIGVRDGVVYYYLYYDSAGFAGLAYDRDGSHLTDTDGALALTRTEAGVNEWFILYDFED